MAFRTLFVCLAAVSAAACVTTPRSASLAPNLTPVSGSPASPRGQLYAGCVEQAAAAGAVDRTDDMSTHLLRFTCSGSPARALFDELKDWSVAHKSQWVADGRTWRSVDKVRHNLFGVDYCSSDGVADYRCAVTLNVGPFLAGSS